MAKTMRQHLSPPATYPNHPHQHTATATGPDRAGIAFFHPAPAGHTLISSPIPRFIPQVIYNQCLSIANTSSIVGAVLHLARVEAKATTSPGQTGRLFGLYGQLPVRRFGDCRRWHRSSDAATRTAPSSPPSTLSDRPVSHTKYAVAISSTRPHRTPGLVHLRGLLRRHGSRYGELWRQSLLPRPEFRWQRRLYPQQRQTFNSFAISTTLMTNDVQQTTLLDRSQSGSVFSRRHLYLFRPAGPQLRRRSTPASPPALQQELPIDPATPCLYRRRGSAPRVYAITQTLAEATDRSRHTSRLTSTPSTNPFRSATIPSTAS